MTLQDRIRAIVRHPCTTLVTALTLIGTSASEAWETIGEDLAEADLGAHHGVMVFGLVSLVRVIPDLIEGFERLVAENEGEA